MTERPSSYRPPKKCKTCKFSYSGSFWYNHISAIHDLPTTRCLLEWHRSGGKDGDIIRSNQLEKYPYVHKEGVCAEWEEATQKDGYLTIKKA